MINRLLGISAWSVVPGALPLESVAMPGLAMLPART